MTVHPSDSFVMFSTLVSRRQLLPPRRPSVGGKAAHNMQLYRGNSVVAQQNLAAAHRGPAELLQRSVPWIAKYCCTREEDGKMSEHMGMGMQAGEQDSCKCGIIPCQKQPRLLEPSVPVGCSGRSYGRGPAMKVIEIGCVWSGEHAQKAVSDACAFPTPRLLLILFAARRAPHLHLPERQAPQEQVLLSRARKCPSPCP